MTAEQGDAGRGRLVALVVAVVVAVVLIGVALLTGGSGGSDGGLRIERSAVANTPNVDLRVFVTDAGANVQATTGGKPNVRVECLDARDAVVVATTHPWPFTDTDDGQADPHVHQRSTSQDVDRVAGCRLAGTDPKLEGRVGAPR
jgi:hypothetical protein